VSDSITCPRCGQTSHNPDDVREGYCGVCHDWTSGKRVRWRVWVDGPNLVADDWVPKTDPPFQPPPHAVLVDQAEGAGLVYLVEMYDPGLPEEEAYYRFGTDAAGMVAPIEMPGPN
jgi:ribosomal protein L37E